MRIFRIMMRVISVALLVSTLICGLYLAGKGAAVDPSSLQFHMTIGIAGVAFGLVTLFLPGGKNRAKT